MSDDVDRAQAHEEADRAIALDAARRRIAASFEPPDPAVQRECIDCGDPIEPARLAALRGCTSRCASCAQDFERAVRFAR